MSEKSPNTIQHAMWAGLTIGLLLALDTFVGSRSSSFARVADILIEAYIILRAFRSVQDFRDTELQGEISLWRCFSYTLNLFFFASLIGALFNVIYYKYIAPEYLTELLEKSKPAFEAMFKQNPNYTEDLLEQLMTPETMAMSSIVSQCMIGMVLGLLFKPFLTRRRDANL